MKNVIAAENLSSGDWFKFAGMICEVDTAESRFINDMTITCFPIGDSRRQRIVIQLLKNTPLKLVKK